MPRVPYVPRTSAPLRPKRKRAKKSPTRRHCAYIVSRRYSTYACPMCGPLGDLTAGIGHAVANQFDVQPES